MGHFIPNLKEMVLNGASDEELQECINEYVKKISYLNSITIKVVGMYGIKNRKICDPQDRNCIPAFLCSSRSELPDIPKGISFPREFLTDGKTIWKYKDRKSYGEDLAWSITHQTTSNNGQMTLWDSNDLTYVPNPTGKKVKIGREIKDFDAQKRLGEAIKDFMENGPPTPILNNTTFSVSSTPTQTHVINII